MFINLYKIYNINIIAIQFLYKYYFKNTKIQKYKNTKIQKYKIQNTKYKIQNTKYKNTKNNIYKKN